MLHEVDLLKSVHLVTSPLRSPFRLASPPRHRFVLCSARTPTPNRPASMDRSQLKDILQQADLCNAFLVADRRLNQAFFADMSSQGAFGKSMGDAAGQKEMSESTGDQGVPEEFPEEGGNGEIKQGIGDGMERCGQDCEAFKKEEPSSAWKHQRDTAAKPCGSLNTARGWGHPNPPPAGDVTMSFVREVLPEMARLSKVVERCETARSVFLSTPLV